jgi:hypothetical protein
MEFYFSKETITYDGSQLASHFALKRFGLRGDGMAAFIGPMEIASRYIADLEDLLDGKTIRSPSMLHFIAEFFSSTLEAAIMRQRLLVRLVADLLHAETGKTFRVDGDDIFLKDSKLSVSIAAPSPVSCLIHLGLNIETEGVPVKAVGLDELGVNPVSLAAKVGKTFGAELKSMAWAMAKVKGVP